MLYRRRMTLPLIFSILWEILGLVYGTARPEQVLLDALTRPFAPTEGASKECLRDSKIYFTELRKYSPWALKMYDASAKVSPGVITGNIQQLGSYDECLKIITNQKFLAQACTATVQFEILKGPRKSLELDMKDLLLQVANASNIADIPSHSVDYEWMWCVPSTCNYLEISEALELALDPLKVDGRLDFAVRVSEQSCHTSLMDKRSFDLADWFYIALLLTFLLIIISSTTYDIYTKDKDQELKYKGVKHKLLTSFSLYTNGKNLLSTNRSGESIACLDGLRFISICWIIYGHTFYMEAVGVKMNRNFITKMHEDWSSLLILNGNIVTDTFFLLSGILLAYTSLIKSKKIDKSSLDLLNLSRNLYLNRYIRLTPAYAMVVGFYATIFNKLGSGLLWNVWVENSKIDCRTNWWTNLLYINNYVNVANICMSQSWYLSVDMQLLWISPIFLYPMIKCNKDRFFWTVTGICLFLSILVPFCVTYFMHLTGTMLYYKNMQDVTNVYLQIYIRVYTRAGPYIIGLALGYLLFKSKGYKIRLCKTYVICGWLIAVTVGLSAILGPRGMYFEDHPYSLLEASFYAGLHRHVFTLSVSWIIFACINGYAGPLNVFLSWRMWIPLSKLTYSAYLTHYAILLYNIGSIRTYSILSIFTSVHAFLGNLSITLVVSLCLSCCFEIPFMNLVREFLTVKNRTNNQLTTKPSAELIFGSNDSGDGIYRSNENIPESKTCSAESIFSITKDCFTYTAEVVPASSKMPIQVQSDRENNV